MKDKILYYLVASITALSMSGSKNTQNSLTFTQEEESLKKNMSSSCYQASVPETKSDQSEPVESGTNAVNTSSADTPESSDAGSFAEQDQSLKPSSKPSATKKPVHTPGPQSTASSNAKENEKPELMSIQMIGILERELKTTDYGGIYMKGDSVIVLAVNSDSVLQVISDHNLGDSVTILPAKYSVKKLAATYRSLEKVFAQYNMTSLSTLVKENCIEVVTATDSERLKKFIKSLKYGDCVKIVLSDQPEELV